MRLLEEESFGNRRQSFLQQTDIISLFEEENSSS